MGSGGSVQSGGTLFHGTHHVGEQAELLLDGVEKRPGVRRGLFAPDCCDPGHTKFASVRCLPLAAPNAGSGEDGHWAACPHEVSVTEAGDLTNEARHRLDACAGPCSAEALVARLPWA